MGPTVVLSDCQILRNLNFAAKKSVDKMNEKYRLKNNLNQVKNKKIKKKNTKRMVAF